MFVLVQRTHASKDCAPANSLQSGCICCRPSNLSVDNGQISTFRMSERFRNQWFSRCPGAGNPYKKYMMNLRFV